MTNPICGDCVDIVAKFLDPMDIINVCKAYHFNWKRPVLHKLFKDSVCRRIDDFFRSYFGERYQDFKKVMIKSETVISGSFILQMILGETWKDSDIDMYLLHEKNKESQNAYGTWLTNLENFFYTDHNWDISVDRAHARYDGMFLDAKKTTRMESIREYDSKRPDSFRYFQVITLCAESVRTMIEKHYDFRICKNGFYYDEEGCHIWITAIRDIVEKKTIFEAGWNHEYSMRRAEKYTKRGFTFISRKLENQ
jgi:hypothetical protein